MSILNVFIEPDIGLVGVDTEAVKPGSPIVEFSKMMVLHHISAVIAFRGTDYVLASASPGLVAFTGSIEQLVELLPGHLKASVDYSREHYQAKEENLGLDFALVGYSEAEGQVIGYLFSRAIGSEDIHVGRIHTRYRSPHQPSWEPLLKGIHADRPGMIALAKHQSRLSRELMPEVAAGGRFFIAEVSRNSINIEQAFEFPKREPGNSGQS
ncbi:hypothetical protein ACNFBT_10985 [Pseudomonas sp. NY15181]|uniref:hypothetical protein n=1 Tax=Pseudomonas sp. NY15181 TaxID=3400349 RepID=UPI003A8A0CB7